MSLTEGINMKNDNTYGWESRDVPVATILYAIRTRITETK
jgi:hypothetical protein